jgi:hypothetical protein
VVQVREAARIPLWRRAMLLPVVIGMSILARGGEMVGMFRQFTAPAYEALAESN